MKKNMKKLFILAGLFVLCLAFSLILLCAGRNAVKDTPVRQKEMAGISVNLVSVLDVEGVMNMTAFNYLPDEFAELDETVSGENDGSVPARRGTYRFYIDTLTFEEWAENKDETLDHLLQTDGSWHLTMYIPPVFSACSVYVQYQNRAYIGSISKYNIDYYVNYSSSSEFDETVMHKTATQPVFIDIPIPSDSKYSMECAVTIHYEADNPNFVGITNGILIGEDAAVRKVVTQNRFSLLIGAGIGAITLLLFLFICILKRSLSFVPQLLFVSGVFSALFSTYLLLGFTATPYFILAVRRFSVGFMLFASVLYLPKKFGKIPVLYPIGAVTVAAAALAFLSPFCTDMSTYTVICRAYPILELVSVAAVLGLTLFDICRNKSLGLRLNNMVSGAVTVTAVFTDVSLPFIVLSPLFWLCLGMLGITLVLGFREFISAEIRNRYLTINLKQEVERQTQSLQTVLSERDKILLYVSHDMKKAVAGMGEALYDLQQNLSAPELVAKTNELLRKNTELKNDFAELGKYGRQSYVAEHSEVLNLSQVIRKVTNELQPDCEANGIVLTVTLPDRLNVYAKKIALESVISNLILNAIEHSFCTHLSISAIKRKGMCRIDIADDGRGIMTDKNIFEPFVSGDPSEKNSGLGLFLAKSAVESMHGALTFERKDGVTVFSATLPLA